MLQLTDWLAGWLDTTKNRRRASLLMHTNANRRCFASFHSRNNLTKFASKKYCKHNQTTCCCCFVTTWKHTESCTMVVAADALLCLSFVSVLFSLAVVSHSNCLTQLLLLSERFYSSRSRRSLQVHYLFDLRSKRASTYKFG